jgi:hypothetical protein
MYVRKSIQYPELVLRALITKGSLSGVQACRNLMSDSNAFRL